MLLTIGNPSIVILCLSSPKKLDTSGNQKYQLLLTIGNITNWRLTTNIPCQIFLILKTNLENVNTSQSQCAVANGFLQIEFNATDIGKTTFTYEQYEQYSLRISKPCLVYMDDIIVYSPTVHEHISGLKEVFQSCTSIIYDKR